MPIRRSAPAAAALPFPVSSQGGGGAAAPSRPQHVAADSCEAFRTSLTEECMGEFDGARPLLGPRPSDGFMHSEDRRPEAAGDTPFARVGG